MKEYPSIPNSHGQNFEGLGLVDVFDKIDGSNMRFYYTKKRGWHKFGSRHCLIDDSHPELGGAVTKFLNDYADMVVQCFKRAPQKLMVYAEWHGPNSFVGLHSDKYEDMDLAFFDCCVDNSGWLAPKEFRKTFQHMPTPAHLGQYTWTRDFIERVRKGDVEGITFEGVVGKTMKGSMLKMGKAKTLLWYNKVRELHPHLDPLS